jgi:hypothetical protein
MNEINSAEAAALLHPSAKALEAVCLQIAFPVSHFPEWHSLRPFVLLAPIAGEKAAEPERYNDKRGKCVTVVVDPSCESNAGRGGERESERNASQSVSRRKRNPQSKQEAAVGRSVEGSGGVAVATVVSVPDKFLLTPKVSFVKEVTL